MIDSLAGMMSKDSAKPIGTEVSRRDWLGASSPALEDAARTSLDLCAGRPHTDTDWARDRSALLEFAIILREWDQKTKKARPEAGNGLRSHEST
jgi:hypothetical protein